MTVESTDNVLFHYPVLYNEIIKLLNPAPGRRYIDCTLGTGGHALGILQSSSPDGCLLGIDVDPLALELARERLSKFGNRVIIKQRSYVAVNDICIELNWDKVDGILLDLGVSTMQLVTPERGFSFLTDGPLDMRFDPSTEAKAQDLVNHLPRKELADLIYRYGEEKESRQIARSIVENRPITGTLHLAEVVKGAVAKGKRRKYNSLRHPATRTFQALRIAVNNELESLSIVLPQAVALLEKGGRLAVISFHSLEDRIVKTFFNYESRNCVCPPAQPICTCAHKASIKLITRRPIQPNQEEVKANPRSRSARLRVAEKIR